MPKGAKFGGRTKGTANKMTMGARHAIFEVFDLIGGAANLGAWAKENPGEFYKLWGKTIPQHTQLTGLNGGAIETKHVTPLDKEILEQWKKK